MSHIRIPIRISSENNSKGRLITGYFMFIIKPPYDDVTCIDFLSSVNNPFSSNVLYISLLWYPFKLKFKVYNINDITHR